ncbi:hypothetical protein BCM02_103221 [Paenibacillus methanolicus]|uniref:Uncharacterized protein n=2 Tax=Paenibacillus methanolicus TaxID=582686 RepID=A0A5S5CBL7_9BACL|nr:hypothetical protein BCM02_103221 [Paenibacillus methanolicus]
MDKAAEQLLDQIWTLLMSIYEKEKARIAGLKGLGPLHPGIMDYMKISLKRSHSSWEPSEIALHLYEPLSFSDDAYRLEAGPELDEMSDDVLLHAFFPEWRSRVEALFLSEDYGAHFFGYRMQLVMEIQSETETKVHREDLRNEAKLEKLKQQLNRFIETKVWKDPPVLPSENDDFFFARHLMNPDLMAQEPDVVEPLHRRLVEKMLPFPKRLEKWRYAFVSACKEWAEERFLDRYSERTGQYELESELFPDDERPTIQPSEMAFFLYIALQIGPKEPDTRKRYLDYAVLLGSEQAAAYLTEGSGQFAARHTGSRMSGACNDVLQTIEIRIGAEEEAAYREALDYLCGLLREGFPRGYQLKLKSAAKHWLPVASLAKSKLHQFFANALQYEALHPLIADYAELAMKEFEWYGDVESSVKSVMPGTYAVFGLGLVSEAYFPLVRRYMEIVDSEHQSAQDKYAEAFVARHGETVAGMPTLVAIVLGASDTAKPVKGIAIDTPELAEALNRALADKPDHLREAVLYRLFGSEKKGLAVLKQAASLRS